MRLLTASLLCALPLALVAVACSTTQNATVGILLGGESDALSRAPAPTSLVVDVVDADGGASTLATVALPTTQAELGDLSQDQSGSVRITGKDGTGATRVWGQTLPVVFGAIAGGTLDVFVQRTGETARMPGALTDAREAPIVGAAAGRYIFVTGGADPTQSKTTAIYDLLTYAALPTPPTLPRAPTSFAISDTYALAIDDQGATILSLLDSQTADVTAPTGGAFGDVLGGASVSGPDGTAYVVGGTRTSSPSGKILSMDVNGTLAFYALTTPRAGAGAAYVAGRGLVVFGGDLKAPAIEVLGPNTTTAIAASFPAWNVTGAAGVALDADRVLFAWAKGTQGFFLTFDLAHPDPSVIPLVVTLPCSARHLDLFTLDAKTAFVVAEDGASCAFTWDGATIKEVPLKIARRGARGVRLPTGAIAIVGGSATVEEFTP